LKRHRWAELAYTKRKVGNKKRGKRKGSRKKSNVWKHTRLLLGGKGKSVAGEFHEEPRIRLLGLNIEAQKGSKERGQFRGKHKKYERGQ